MLKTKSLSIISILVIAIVTSLFFHNCATIIESECAAIAYNGTYSGEIKVAGLLPLEDTITVVVDTSENKITATFSSKLLNKSLMATFLPNQSIFEIDTISVDELIVEGLKITEIKVKGGTSNLDGSCECLSFSLIVSAVIDNSPIPPSHQELENVDITTIPDYLCRL